MQMRYINNIAVSELGLGCMNVNHAYLPMISREQTQELLSLAYELGISHFDTAALYGFGMNEEWVGTAIKSFRSKIFLASKCGMTGVNGKRVIDGRPETLMHTCSEALQRLQVDHIDLYYLHRRDKRIPIEESVGALAEMVAKGWIRAIGLSEVSSTTLRRAHAVHPIAAVQSEYSLWTRDPESRLLDACRELGVALVAFSPLGRGFLAGTVNGQSQFETTDIRSFMPRFQSPHLEHNVKLISEFDALAIKAGVTKAQLALAWLLQRAPHVIPIFGTTSLLHLRENIAASQLILPQDILERIDAIFNASDISGARYPASAMREVDTEELTIQ